MGIAIKRFVCVYDLGDLRKCFRKSSFLGNTVVPVICH